MDSISLLRLASKFEALKWRHVYRETWLRWVRVHGILPEETDRQEAFVEKRYQPKGKKTLWAVSTTSGFELNKHCLMFDGSKRPSERDGEYYDEYRFHSMEEAFDYVDRFLEKQGLPCLAKLDAFDREENNTLVDQTEEVEENA